VLRRFLQGGFMRLLRAIRVIHLEAEVDHLAQPAPESPGEHVVPGADETGNRVDTQT
jgi:hypothetical protein